MIAADSRNEGIAIRGHYKHWVNPAVLVFDLRDLPGTAAPLDVDPVFLQVMELPAKLVSRRAAGSLVKL